MQRWKRIPLALIGKKQSWKRIPLALIANKHNIDKEKIVGLIVSGAKKHFSTYFQANK